MAIKYASKTYRVEDHTNRLDKHDQLIAETLKDIKITKELTFYFTVIVAVTLICTLIGTLIGLGGLYISAFNNAKIQHEDDVQKETLDKVLLEMMKISEKTYTNENQIKLIKQRNPYIK